MLDTLTDILAYLQQLHWHEPLWLLLALQPLLLVLLRSILRRHRLNTYADPDLQPWVISHHRRALSQRIFSRDTAYILAWLAFSIALAGPRLPLEIPGEEHAQGIDIMIAIDISRSMSVTDIPPSRLRRARTEIQELLQKTEGNRVGIIVYAGRPHVYVPLTSDHAALNYYLDNLDRLALPTHGSDMSAALALAHKEIGISTRNKAILLVTDGDMARMDDKQRQQLIVTARSSGEKNIPVYILGVGSIEGDAIPLVEGGWLTYQSRPVISRMDETLLQKLAEQAKGQYSAVQDDDSDWDTLYERGINAGKILTLDKSKVDRIIWLELYGWTLLPAILLLCVALNPYRITTSRMKQAIPAVAILVISFSMYDSVFADELATEQQAWQAYQRGDYSAANKLYEQLHSYAGQLGEGASLYRQGNYTSAVRQFSQALLNTESDSERASALYNLGNSYFQQGDYANAITAYSDALIYRPTHNTTQINLAFSRALQKKVEERLRLVGNTRRMGSGPQSAHAEESIDVNERGDVSIDDSSDNQEPDNQNLPLPDIDDAILAGLVERGIDHVRLASGNSTNGLADKQRRADLPISTALLRMREIEDQQGQLWKRMFEMEENFPASVDEPLEIPGVPPW